MRDGGASPATIIGPLLLVGLLWPGAARAADSSVCGPAGGQYVCGEVLVKLTPEAKQAITGFDPPPGNTGVQRLDDVNVALGVRSFRILTVPGPASDAADEVFRWYVASFDGDVMEAVGDYLASGAVEAAEPNAIVSTEPPDRSFAPAPTSSPGSHGASGPPPRRGGSVDLRLSPGAARAAQRHALRARFPNSYRRGRRASSRCHRRSPSKFRCLQSWRHRKYLYRGILDIRMAADGIHFHGHVNRRAAKVRGARTYRLKG